LKYVPILFRVGWTLGAPVMLVRRCEKQSLHDGAGRGFWQAFSTSFPLIFVRFSKLCFFAPPRLPNGCADGRNARPKPQGTSLVFFMTLSLDIR
jgi:hypothetical protein